MARVRGGQLYGGTERGSGEPWGGVELEGGVDLAGVGGLGDVAGEEKGNWGEGSALSCFWGRRK